MVPIKKDISINLNKLIDFVTSKKEQYLTEKVLHYIRIYTDLVRAEENLTEAKYPRMLNYMRVVRNMAKDTTFKGEDVFLKRIGKIANEILGGSKRLKSKVKKLAPWDAYSDPHGARTKLQLGQNICLLRVLQAIK